MPGAISRIANLLSMRSGFRAVDDLDGEVVEIEGIGTGGVGCRAVGASVNVGGKGSADPGSTSRPGFESDQQLAATGYLNLNPEGTEGQTGVPNIG